MFHLLASLSGTEGFVMGGATVGTVTLVLHQIGNHLFFIEINENLLGNLCEHLGTEVETHIGYPWTSRQ